jgi:hypothetical protein
MSAARFSDLPLSLAFAAQVVFPGLPESLPGRLDSSLILLLTAKHAAQPSHGLWFKVRPLRSWEGHSKVTDVKRRHINVATQRSETDLGVSCERRSQQILQLRDPPFNGESLCRGILVPAYRLFKSLLALTGLAPLLFLLGCLLLGSLFGCPLPV